MDKHQNNWDTVINPKRGILEIPIKEIWKYRDLLLLFVKRDFVANFKQTILGPAWFVIQPLFQALIIFFVFGKVANFLPDDVHGMSFYLAGVMCWFFFSNNLLATSNTFTLNSNIFGKVYFPRLIMPLSVLFSSALKLLVQLMLFLAVFLWAYFVNEQGAPNMTILLVPLYFIHAGLLSLGIGLLISSLTTKYRDLKFLVQFGIQLLMYISTVPYPLSKFADGSTFKLFMSYNPMSPIIEATRFAFMGEGAGTFDSHLYFVSLGVTFFFLIIGVLVFNRVEKNFMDTV